MFGMNILAVGAVLTIASSQPAAYQPAQANSCPLMKSAEITVTPTESPIAYDTSKTLQQLQAASTDTIDPYGFHGVTMKQGYTATIIKMQPEVQLLSQYTPSTGAVCLSYDKVAIKINMKSTIVLAKEVVADPCMREAVIGHEMKHVNADRRLVNKYANIMGQKVYAALKERGFRAEPTTKEYARGMTERMQKLVFQILEHEYKKLDLDRSEAQGAIDSVQEYDRVSKECPDFYKEIPAWASSSAPR